jgi:hypothetical protein
MLCATNTCTSKPKTRVHTKDHEQDQDMMNTTTQRGTKILEKQIELKNCGAQRGYRIAELFF